MNSRTNIDSVEGEDNHFINQRDVVIGKVVGEGQFGSVYVGKYFGDYVAVKRQICDAGGVQEYLQREIKALRKLQHDHIMTFHGTYEVVDESTAERVLYIVSEFCQGGDLLDLLSDHDQALGWKFRINVAAQAASAIQYMHENNIIHRDIKSSNILMNREWHCKICDFGLAREVDVNSSNRMTLCGTNEYMAPELLFDEGNYSFEIDVFSFGMVLLEIMRRGKVGTDGFAERSPRSKFQLDLDSVRSMIPKDTPESLLSLAFQCVDDEPSNRPAVCDALDWLEDLLGDYKNDVTPMPTLRHAENVLSSLEALFKTNQAPPTATTTTKSPEKIKTNKIKNNQDQQFLDFTAKHILLASKYTAPKADGTRKTIRSPHGSGVPSHIVSPSPSASTSPIKAKKKSALQDLQLLTRFVTEQAVAPSRASSVTSVVRTKSSTLLVSTSSKDKGREKEVKSCPVDFAMISGKDRDIENKSPLRERPSSVNASNKTKSKERDNDAKSVPKEKSNLKDFMNNNNSNKMKEKETDNAMKAEGFCEEKATKEKEKESEREKEKEKEKEREKEREKEKEKERRASRQEGGVATPDLMRPRSTAPKLKYKSQSMIIHPYDVSASPDSKSLDLAHHLETSPSRSLAHPTSPSVISMSPLGRLNEIAASLRMLSPVRHQSEGGLTIGHHNDCTDFKFKANLSKTQGYPTSHSLIQSAFRFENFDAPVGPYNPDTAASRFRTESFATLPSRSDSITEEGQELAPHDKIVVKDGFIYKKNTTGFFRSWKRVFFTITRRHMLWTSSAGLNSAYYDLRGATIIKTLQFRFQIMNMTGWERGSKTTQREFAAESYADMDEWVRALQEAIDRANQADPGGRNSDSIGSVYQSLSELESTENPRFDPARCRSRSTSTISPFRTPRESDLEDFKCITMKANTVDEVTRKEERKRVRSLRKSASDLSLTGPPSIGGWLECLGLKQYESHFIREGFNDIESVQIIGLKDETLDRLGIHIPLHRTVLQSFGCRQFTNDIEVDVTRSREIGGVLTLYTVVTSWRCLRSTVSLQYSDFKDYHVALETALKDQPALLNNIPKLPDPKLFTVSALSLDAIGELNMSDSCSSMLAATSPLRHQVLQSYVRQLAILLENTPFLGSLFTFLELTPSVPY